MLSEKTKSKLLPYQINHTQNLITSLQTNHRVLDASDTGTGKTYTAIASCVELGLKPLIICPKSVINSWHNVIEHFDYHENIYGIANYELIKNCRYYNRWKEKIACPYINAKKILITNNRGKQEVIDSYTWNLPEDSIIVIDEAHSCKNKRTFNSQLLLSLAEHSSQYVMIISATICDKPETFRNYGLLMGFYRTLKESKYWISKVGTNFHNPMLGVRKFLFPEYASRMSIKELGDLFPSNQIIAKAYDMKEAPEIEKMYQLIKEAEEDLKNKEDGARGLAKITYARQRIENMKVPTMIELAKQFLEEGNSVAIFVNFTESLRSIGEALKTRNFIFGEQTLDERDGIIKRFQDDKERVIIANIKAGGLGISLHDLNGEYPRVSIISPSWSASDVLQALGRIFRAKGKTPVRQRIVYCAKTYEEEICKNMTEKINNIACLNDGHNKNYLIKGLNEEEVKEEDDPLSQVKRLEMKIMTLALKKERLTSELREVELELRSLRYIYQNYQGELKVD